MANRFWVGGTGTWDASNTASWAATSGGAGGETVPGSNDWAIFDANSGGGTVTVDSPNGAGVVAVQRIDCGAFTGTLDFSANNNDVTLTHGTGFNGSGSGARTIKLGSGTWTLTGESGQEAWSLGTTTNLTFDGADANVVLTGNVGRRAFHGGGQTYGSLSIESNSSRGNVVINGNNTFGSLSVAPGTTIQWTGASTNTIVAGFNLSGTVDAPIAFLTTVNIGFTLSLGGACTINWGVAFWGTVTGDGSLTISNGLDLGSNSNITITGPSGSGGGARQKVFGG